MFQRMGRKRTQRALHQAGAGAGEIEVTAHSPVHEAEGQECSHAVRGYHEHDSNDLALLPGLHEV